METEKMINDMRKAFIAACILIPLVAFLTCWQMEKFYQRQSGGQDNAVFSPEF